MQQQQSFCIYFEKSVAVSVRNRKKQLKTTEKNKKERDKKS
jgi:hypothetical protein